VIPAFDEERRIGPTLERLGVWLAAQPGTAEIVVVDDGSRDGTRALVESIALHASPSVRVRVLAFDRNRGKGHAVRSGVLAAEGEIIAFYDADGSAPPTELGKLAAAIGAGADVALGSRRNAREVERSWKRTIVSRSFNLLVRAIVKLDVSDSQCGIKAFHREAARAIFERQKLDGFAFDCEVLAIASRQGWRVVDVPVSWRDAEGSKLDVARASIAMLRDLTRIRRLVRDVKPIAKRTHANGLARGPERAAVRNGA
jgi:dolichyl-phosphate beta-glucosyltransferase